MGGGGSEGHVYDWDRYISTLPEFQPNTLWFSGAGFLKEGHIRWCGNEESYTEADNWNMVDVDGVQRWRPQECETPLRKGVWFWHPNSEKNLKSLEALLEIYHRSVGYGAQLMMGLAPDNRGLAPESDAARLREFGIAIRRMYSNNLARGGSIDASRTLIRFPGTVTFDRVVTMEDLHYGQHVHRYQIEALVRGAWTVVAAARTIGHKKIDRFPAVTASAARLRVLESSATPRIRDFAVYLGSGAVEPSK